MVSKIIQRTSRGLPVLTIQTLEQYHKELVKICKKSPKDKEDWINNLLKDVKLKNPCYERFIRDTADFYPKEDYHNKNALERLTAGYVLLDREGQVPKLEEDEYEKTFKVLSPRSIAIMNMGVNLDPIKDENPNFFNFIMYSSIFMPTDNKDPLDDIINPSLRNSLMSDLSNGYTILTHCQKQKQTTSS